MSAPRTERRTAASNPSDGAPAVSVVVRSYGRLLSLAELLEALLSQRHPSFEVVVVEQTPSSTATEREALAPAFADPRVRVIERPPLGGPGARNEGVRHARGDIVVLIDDDDLPLGDDWISAHADYYAAEPKLVGLTARHVVAPNEASPYPAVLPLPTRWIAKRRCMSYSTLKTPYTFARLDVDVAPVGWLHGTNASFRRRAILDAGLWDETVRTQDEHSLAFRLARRLEPDQYLAFKAYPPVLRRKGLPGGMAKRRVGVDGELRNHLQFLHRVVGRYHPRRFSALYPVYLAYALARTMGWAIQDATELDSIESRLWQCVAALGRLPTEVLAELRFRSDGAAPSPGPAAGAETPTTGGARWAP